MEQVEVVLMLGFLFRLHRVFQAVHRIERAVGHAGVDEDVDELRAR